jgi:BMFP domain-containing protein YqiC
MLDPKILDDLAKRLADSVPSGVRIMQDDLRKNIRAILESNLARLDLVTRAEFDAQSAVLGRTREKIEGLEGRVRELEALLERNGDGR